MSSGVNSGAYFAAGADAELLDPYLGSCHVRILWISDRRNPWTRLVAARVGVTDPLGNPGVILGQRVDTDLRFLRTRAVA
jgi:hypothetical protein